MFQLGVFNATSQRAVLGPALFPIDHGTFAWAAAGLAESDGRILAVGWVHAKDQRQELADGCPKVGGISVCGVQAISLVRVLSYDAKSKMLLANIAEEYSSLRNATLVAPRSLSLAGGGEAVELPIPPGKGLASDVVFKVTLGAQALALEATVMATGPATSATTTADGVTLSLNISAAATPGGARVGSAKIRGSVAPTGWFDFPILAGEAQLPVRVLVDRSIAEFFIGDGRTAFTARHYPQRSAGGVRMAALSAAPLTLSASVYEMGCGCVL